MVDNPAQPVLNCRCCYRRCGGVCGVRGIVGNLRVIPVGRSFSIQLILAFALEITPHARGHGGVEDQPANGVAHSRVDFLREKHRPALLVVEPLELNDQVSSIEKQHAHITRELTRST